MFEAGKFYRHRYDDTNIYKAERVEQQEDGGQSVWWTWDNETRANPFRRTMGSRDWELHTEVTENGEPIIEEERNEPMWQIGDLITTPTRAYTWKITEIRGNEVNLLTIGSYGEIWPEARHFSIDWCDTTANEFVRWSPEPEADAFVEAAQHAVVYMAYTQSRNTGTITIISHVDEERFNAMLRAQEGQGFRTLAKKKIKFTI